MNSLSRIFLTGMLISGGLWAQTGSPYYELQHSETISTAVKSWIFAGKYNIAVGKQQLQFLEQDEGYSRKLPEGTLFTVFSKGFQYYAAVRLLNEEGQDKIFNIDVFSIDNRKMYSLQFPNEYDEPYPFVVVSDADGSLILGKGITAEMLFYDHTGRLLREIKIFSDAGYDLERMMHIDISRDGSEVAVAAGKRGASSKDSATPNPSAEPHVFLFDPAGNEIWRKALPGFNTSVISISGNGDYIAANSYTVDVEGGITRNALVLDRKGTEIGRTDMLFKFARFSPGSRFLLLGNNSSAYLMEVSRATVLWRQTIDSEDGMFTAGSLADDARTAVLLVAENEYRHGEFVFVNPTLKILERSGDLTQSIQLPGQTFIRASLKFSEDGRQILVGFSNGYHIYRRK
jgi:hypothetical protein